ncbi:MAG: tRNA (adenosine(37)-N6)-threonylcarbamoyltransferase complex ATPase subunit type 1 TsaE [candidate division Zixibacteria bacterium]|nr:tRNA (adenosine(37)-N6)-threonylcarbamoyltransferase complex ATPase subunit type 1 TsaE [candidate division Zixibacteria bacterium]MDH3938583.1 tRNA (adenosine(37)-N6)-threonylcarbamoyltransferase complex ATPase subunit type 1 TsaE [candidate division Zixibacteria bacterium]MDH4033688.1 tRNA (adenosine(37)-N6)-threonylcarbamoyltransferase complex ATPase subunit type 1 TsaE [candidate division Zixibacteria bacterium]
MTFEIKIVSHGETETQALASKLVPLLRPGDLLVLKGELGAGKTVFVRGLAEALGLDTETVNSPSYTVVNEYPGERPLFHFDLYRVQDPSELYEIGWDDYLGRRGLIVVEWGDKAAECLPPAYYLVDFQIIDEKTRQINLTHVKS